VNMIKGTLILVWAFSVFAKGYVSYESEILKVKSLLHPESRFQNNLNEKEHFYSLQSDSISADKFKMRPSDKIISIDKNELTFSTDRELGQGDLDEFEFINHTKFKLVKTPVWTALSESNSSPCADANKNVELKLPIENLSDLTKHLDCSLTVKCSESGQSENWDYYASGIDLMQKELDRIQLKDKDTKVAVVDTPIDQKSENLINAKIVRNKDETKLVDENGHGTFVASRIAAVAPGATITSFPVLDKNGHTNHIEILKALTKACESGNEVINLSAGSSINGIKIPMELYDGKIAGQLEERGCLVIQAEGNEG
jgi:hypothetical protein